MDSKGNLLVNGKPISEAAVEQRLRRYTKVRKNGKCKSGPELKERFDDLETRGDVIALFKKCLLDKDRLK